ncbi:uncharacterized protein LOC134672695 [Cydia fagiglandana]|uniref:uncharacterized protein LOC134672695 n=1 Tax=Cydia fagiglandana TaxID=1458189 RepID=UPI002FEE5892
MCKLFVIFSIIYISLPFCASISCRPCPKIEYNRIPAYILYILGFMSILLIVVLISLIYVLWKTNFLKRKHTTQSAENFEGRDAQCPTCQKKRAGGIHLEKNTGDFKNQNDNVQVHTLKRQESEVIITNDFNNLRSPKKSDASGNISPRIIKGVAKDLPYILPEQMTLICKEVLKRAAKNDSINSLQNIDQLVNESKPKDEIVFKFASTPALDLCDTLTTPHSDRKIQFDTNCSTQPGTRTSSISKTDKGLKSRSNSRDDKPEPNLEIYDFPKEPNNIYDTFPEEKSVKVKNVSGYVTPCFENELSSGHFDPKEEKRKYADIKDISSEQSTIKNKCTDYNEYDNPKNENGLNKMYMNANDVKYNKAHEVI